MESYNGHSLCCSESVIIGVNRKLPLPEFSSSTLRIGSVFCGGIAGHGEVCGAVSGAAICLGMTYGTMGTETTEKFKQKRKFLRSKIKEYLVEFTSCWGTVRCELLRAMDDGKIPAEGTRREGKPIKNYCDEYVQWSIEYILSMLNDRV